MTELDNTDCGHIAYALERWAADNPDPTESAHLRELAELVYTHRVFITAQEGNRDPASK